MLPLSSFHFKLIKIKLKCFFFNQFFKDIDSILELLKYNKIIIIAALDATFEVKPFQNILNLIHHRN